MSPSEFTFKLTIPNDPEGVTVLAAVAKHAVDYANMDAATGAAFVDRVRATAAEALKATTGTSCLAVFAAEDGRLTVTIGNHAVHQPLPA
jgi:hypothetical protein